jgi:hypothetical protein
MYMVNDNTLSEFWYDVNNRKIDAIKKLREVSGLGLKEAKDLVEVLRGEYPVAGQYRPQADSSALKADIESLKRELKYAHEDNDAAAQRVQILENELKDVRLRLKIVRAALDS